jgi:hypothetical protein
MAFETASSRRRFFLERGLRRASIGSGSDLALLMSLPREPIDIPPELLFGDIRAVVIGGVATRAFAPERYTKDVDYLVDHDRFEEACQRLVDEGWQRREALFFPDASLGLAGRTWQRKGRVIDTISSPQSWASEAVSRPSRDQTGLTVIDLPYLVLMKLDSARAIDQADLSRMLGRIDDDAVLESIVSIVDRYAHDPQAAEDVRQYALLGKMEYARERSGKHPGERDQ